MKTIGLNFEGKVAVVTGGAGRIGRPLCEKFATAGTAVAVVDLDAAGNTAPMHPKFATAWTQPYRRTT